MLRSCDPFRSELMRGFQPKAMRDVLRGSIHGLTSDSTHRAPTVRQRTVPTRRRGLLWAALTAGTLLMAGACGGDSGTKAVPPTEPPTITSLVVNAPSTTINVQQTVQLSATARLSDGSSNGTPSVVWTTSASSVATVSGAGLVTGVAAGTAVITATTGVVSGTATITVTLAAGALASVSVALTDSALQLGQTTQATVSGKDGTGAALAIGSRPVTWTSSNVVVATVSGSGVVSAVGVGTANIQVSVVDGGATRTASVSFTGSGLSGAPTSTDVVMPGLTFSPFQAVVKQGGTVRFIFPALTHNVFWDARLTGQSAAPADINDTQSTTVSRVFPSVGVFSYKCKLHPGMEGSIIVSP
jgi:plastocyanin